VLSLQPNTVPNLPPTVRIATPTNSAFLAADHLSIATSSEDDGLVTSVEYFANDQLIGQTTSEPHTLLWTNVGPGAYTLSARATDHLGLSATSAPVNIVVGLPAVSLIATGAVWRYLDTGANLGTTWRALNFPDTNWPAGPAQLGFGDGDETTVIASNRQWTTYFRRTFDLPSPLIVTNLLLRLLRDDGAVVYINTNEVWRSNMPATGAILYNTPASSSVPAADESTNFYTTNINASVLVPGTNIVAVEVHQNAITSSDLSFDFEMSALHMATPHLTAAPVSGARVRIAWPAGTPASVALQRSTYLNNDWTDLTGSVLEGSERAFYDAFGAPGQFYRLHQP
jgi:hypothetical protein